MPLARAAYFSPTRILLFSLLGMIALGTLLLSLPICHNHSISLIDLLFTALSATCVSGMQTVPLEHFSYTGHIVILLLIQIGGLGIITLTFFLISMFARLNFTTQLMAGQLLDLESSQQITQTISFIIIFSLLVEMIGATILWYFFMFHYPSTQALFYAVFHSISAFCHAGFSLFPHDFILWQTNIGILLTLIGIMVVASLGFPTWYETSHTLYSWHTKIRHTLSLHSKLVYIITFITILVGTFLFFWLERDHTLNHLSPLTALINSLFITVSARGIGFSTLSVASLTYASGLLIMALAFIGSSPGSPGSGVKTTTFAVLCAFIKSALREDQSVLLYGRKVARDQLNRAITIVVLAISWIIIALFLMLICESHFAFFDLLFELVSAFGTLGLSTGITPHLHTSGKVIIMITTLVGRVGVISFLLSLLPFHPKKEFSYPEERIMLG